MSDILCVTNISLCRGGITERIRDIAAAKPKGIILRAKELSADEYTDLARTAVNICRKAGTPLILHGFSEVAAELGVDALHLPLDALRRTDTKRFRVLGASCHSVDDAKEAESHGCTYITAGHIYETDCKRGVMPRGLDFLKAVCESVSVPVYAIGGISPENIGDVQKAGAAGGCVMSGIMQCTDVKGYLKAYEI